jgi:uncharacterized pyridoxamine 5'-phosphate oxidase family protein
MHVQHFTDIETEFIQRVHTIVWCNVATVDSQQRPRSRILHPIWEGSTGWILTERASYKSQHLAANPYISLAYIADITKPVYADCTAQWVEDQQQKQHVWDLFAAAPEPLGYDPAPFFGSVADTRCGLLQLTPWRIALVTFPAPSQEEGQRIWRSGSV